MSSPSSLPADPGIDELYQQAYASALRLLARREHSVQELCLKLKGRGYAAALVEQLASELVDEGLLSDRRFAEHYVYSRIERGFGPLRIRADLRDRGVGDGLAEEAVWEAAPDWQSLACRQRQKRFGEVPPQDFNARVKQLRFLQQRGFSSEQARRACSRSSTDD